MRVKTSLIIAAFVMFPALSPLPCAASFYNAGVSMSLLSIQKNSALPDNRDYYAANCLFAAVHYFPSGEDLRRNSDEDLSEYVCCTFPSKLFSLYPWAAINLNAAYNGDHQFVYPSLEAGLYFINIKAGVGYSFEDRFGPDKWDNWYSYFGYMLPLAEKPHNTGIIFEIFVKLYFSGDSAGLIYSDNTYDVGIKAGILF